MNSHKSSPAKVHWELAFTAIVTFIMRFHITLSALPSSTINWNNSLPIMSFSSLSILLHFPIKLESCIALQIFSRIPYRTMPYFDGFTAIMDSRCHGRARSRGVENLSAVFFSFSSSQAGCTMRDPSLEYGLFLDFQFLYQNKWRALGFDERARSFRWRLIDNTRTKDQKQNRIS